MKKEPKASARFVIQGYIDKIKKEPSKKSETLKKTGFCFYCDEPTAHVFCDSHCKELFEKGEIR